jgi:hypothetical protein
MDAFAHQGESTRSRKMNTNRFTAIIVGVLYIIGTVSGILSVIVTGSTLDAPNSPAQISANANQLIYGALLVLTMGLALAMVPVLLYPILKKQNPALALGYVVFRGALETVTCLILAISWLTLVMTAKTYLQSGAVADSTFQVASTLLVSIGATSLPLGYIAFSLGASMLYSMLFQSRLIPRWISGWGLVAVVPYFAAASLNVLWFTDPQSAISSLMYLPMFIQEMVMAVWFIAKGFNTSAHVAESAMQSNWSLV